MRDLTEHTCERVLGFALFTIVVRPHRPPNRGEGGGLRSLPLPP